MASKKDLVATLWGLLDGKFMELDAGLDQELVTELQKFGPEGLGELSTAQLTSATKKMQELTGGAVSATEAAASAAVLSRGATPKGAAAKKNPIRNVGRVTAIEAKEKLMRLSGVKMPKKQQAAVKKLLAMLDRVIKGDKIPGSKAQIMSTITPLLKSHGLIRPATGAAGIAAATKAAAAAATAGAATGAEAAAGAGASAASAGVGAAAGPVLGQGEAASQIAAAVKAFSKPGLMSSLQASPIKTLAGPAILAYLAYNLWSKSQEQGLQQSGAEEEMASMESPELMMLKAMVPQMGQKTAAMQGVSQQMLQRSPWLSPIPGEVVT